MHENVRVTVGKISLELPASLIEGRDTAIDSAARVFEGGGLRVIVDQGPFANRLDSYIGLPDYREESRDIDGAVGRTVSFREPAQGTSTLAVHVPAPVPLTVVIEADGDVAEATPREIIDSLRWTG